MKRKNNLTRFKVTVDICPHCFQHLAQISTDLALFWLDLCDLYAYRNGTIVLDETKEPIEYLCILENLNYISTTDVFAKDKSTEIDVKVYGYFFKSYCHRDFCLTPDICG